MRESTTCLIHAFAYGSGTPNEAKEGNPIHVLGESISFGRFMSESLSWEKWSSFSQNRYVEEAEKYSKPGSVAQKKAFFEAHYKRIAAQKAAAAAAAAALLEQERPHLEVDNIDDNVSAHGAGTPVLTAHDSIEEQQDAKTSDASASNSCIEVDKLSLCEVKEDGYHVKGESSSQFEDVDSHDESTKLEIDKRSEMEKPLLKETFELTDWKKVASRASKIQCSPEKCKATTVDATKNGNIATPLSRNVDIDHSNAKRFSSKQNHLLTPAREYEKLTIPEVGIAKGSKGVASFVKTYYCLTPRKTPSKVPISKHSSRTPQSENKSRTRTPVHPSASGSKTIGSKWRFLAMDFSKTLGTCRNKSSPSPIISSPFNLRTEERAARRKEKLEEKFNEKVVHKVLVQTKVKERAESELKKLRQSLCFKARPLPEFYKERKPLNNPIQMIPWPQSVTPNPGRKQSSSMASDTISLSSRIPASQKSSGGHVIPIKNRQKTQNHIRHPSLAEIIMHENTSPNIVF